MIGTRGASRGSPEPPPGIPPPVRRCSSSREGRLHRRASAILLAMLLAAASAAPVLAASPSAPAGTAASAPAASPPPCPRPLQAMVDEAAQGSVLRLPTCTSIDELRIDRPLVVKASGTVIDGRGVLSHAVVVTADDVEIDGLTVTRVANPSQDGAVRAWDVHRFVFRSGTITDSAGACISVARSPDALVADSTFSRCGQEGIHATRADGLRVERDRIEGNNPRMEFDPEWEAGGVKVTRSTGVSFAGNKVSGNQGPGIWCDIDCRQLVVRDNDIWSNLRAGIQVEISDGATVDGNRVWENGWGKPTSGWGAGILVSSSRGVAVTRNLLAWNADGIVIVSQDRADAPSSIDHDTTSTNTVAMASRPDAFGLAWLQDWSGALFLPSSANAGSGDAFWYDAPESGDARFAWSGPIQHLADFNATPGGRGATYIDTAALDRILEAAGMPARPSGERPVAAPDRRTVLGMVALAALGAGLLGVLWYLGRRRRSRGRPAAARSDPP